LISDLCCSEHSLTTSVLSEAVANKTSVIVAYHPPIFNGLKSLTLANPLQTSLLHCAAQGISIYSPHTALDAVWDGVNDWLAQGILGGGSGTVKSLVQDKISPTGINEGGEGRLVTLHTPTTIESLHKKIKSHLNLSQIQVGYGDKKEPLSLVTTVAICAGSGGSMLAGTEADVYFTGEMSHHEVLAAVAAGKHVILCGHTNTERGYLPFLASKLSHELAKDESLGHGPVEVAVSQNDKHPLVFV